MLLLSCTSRQKSTETSDQVMTNLLLVQRGEYLVTTMGCADCHSPKRMGPNGPEVIPELSLSGYPAERPLMQVDIETVRKGWVLFQPDLTAAVGPWGISFAANITSDPTSIGSWTEESFIRAMKEGKYKGLPNSRPLLPPMPWENYAKMDTADLRATFAYLKTTPPVHNVVPAAIPPEEIR